MAALWAVVGTHQDDPLEKQRAEAAAAHEAAQRAYVQDVVLPSLERFLEKTVGDSFGAARNDAAGRTAREMRRAAIEELRPVFDRILGRQTEAMKAALAQMSADALKAAAKLAHPQSAERTPPTYSPYAPDELAPLLARRLPGVKICQAGERFWSGLFLVDGAAGRLVPLAERDRCSELAGLKPYLAKIQTDEQALEAFAVVGRLLHRPFGTLPAPRVTLEDGRRVVTAESRTLLAGQPGRPRIELREAWRMIVDKDGGVVSFSLDP